MSTAKPESGRRHLDFHQPQTAVQSWRRTRFSWPSRRTVAGRAGAAVTAGVRVINFTDHVDQFIVEVRGLPPLVQLAYQGTLARRAEIGLFQTQSRIAPASDAQAALQIMFNPPASAIRAPGHPFTIRVTTRSSPRLRREIAGMLVILPFQGVELGDGIARTPRNGR